MNNIYLPDGFPSTPDVKELEGQYTAGDGIAFGPDGSISVDYGPGVTMTSTDKLTIDYGPGLGMTTTDKLTIKAGNGLQLSGADLAAKIGTGLSFGGDGSINGNELPKLVTTGITLGSSVNGYVGYCIYGDLVFFVMDLYLPSLSAGGTLCTGLPAPSRSVNFPSFLGYMRTSTGSTVSTNAMIVVDLSENGTATIHNNMQLAGSNGYVCGFYKKA